jgi:hypothetical protein
MLRHLTVYASHLPKVRVGAQDGDGGYVIADGLSYDCLVSGGIHTNNDFEYDFVEQHRVPCFAFDGSIYDVPRPHDRIHFYPQYISVDSLPNHTNAHSFLEPFNDIFLKLDIETYELRWFHSLSQAQMNKFKQIVCEFHFPCHIHCFDTLDKQIPVPEKMAVFEKIARTHKLIHFHPNNACSTYPFEGKLVPNIFECTYIRNDVYKDVGLNRDPIPGPLDRINVPSMPEVYVNFPPFVN